MQTPVAKKSMSTILVALILVTASFEGKAVTVRGVSSCGEWTQETLRNGVGKPDASSRFWLYGYLSGLAVAMGKDAVKGTDSDSLVVWVSNYCQRNPLDTISDAGGKLFDELVIRKRL